MRRKGAGSGRLSFFIPGQGDGDKPLVLDKDISEAHYGNPSTPV